MTQQTKTQEIKVDEAWKSALKSWSSPSVPYLIAPTTQDEMQQLGEIGNVLRGEFAFMKYPEYQTYLNLERIANTFPSNPQRATKAIATHEVGHRFCPYDTITNLVLNHAGTKALQGQTLPYDVKSASRNLLNLFTDMCINTNSTRGGNEDLTWVYNELSKDKMKSRLWRVYGHGMELAWGKEILPKGVKLDDAERNASQGLAGLFERDYFDKANWKENFARFAQILSPFLEDEKKDGEGRLDNAPGDNLPKNLDDRIAQELAKRVAQIGSDGLPQNPVGLKEFQEIMVGYGQGDPKQASIQFYDMLSKSYDVMFATRPFGRPRVNPFQPVKWSPSMGAEKLDIDYSAQVGGRIIPGVNTYAWKTRKREAFGGLEEVVPDLDIYLDSSGTMPNPIEQISLPVLAGFVAAKKAYRKGAKIRAVNFSGQGQTQKTEEYTRNLQLVYEVLVTSFNGGTVFPTEILLSGNQPKQALIITDTFLANEGEAANAVTELIKGNKGNRVTVYEINSNPRGAYLRNAGADVIQGTTTDIFKRVIGKADEVYTK